MTTDTIGRPAPLAPPPTRAAWAGSAGRSASRGVTELTLSGSLPAAVLGEDLDELLDVLVPVEPLLDDRAAAHGHRPARLGLAHEALERGGQGEGILLGDEQASPPVLDQLGNSRHVGRDHRDLHRHRLDEDVGDTVGERAERDGQANLREAHGVGEDLLPSEAVRDAGQREEIGLPIGLDDVALRQGAGQTHAVAQPVAVDETLEFPSHRALAEDDALECPAALAEDAAGLDEVREPLAGIEAAAREDGESLGCRWTRGAVGDEPIEYRPVMVQENLGPRLGDHAPENPLVP